ncbi:Imm10 family immunity protein [Zavarzinella formosa]|uniref:Imm10 family immunity protein n=1 Tax=Zavarzinella formosa TaxID=360055 RepID=UPI000365C22B|nr:Imm10 family immunity protein [Zavarzinella formosa]
MMREFHATAVEVFTDEGMLTVHFDDGADHYLQLQSPEADTEDFETGYGSVYVELDDQSNAGVNCFSAADLTRTSFRLTLARDAAMSNHGIVVVTFEIDDDAYASLRLGLERLFRSFTGFSTA